MKKLFCFFSLLSLGVSEIVAQGLSNASLVSPTPPAKKNNPTPAPTILPTPSPSASPDEMITTEIYSDHAFFDSSKSIGVFTGHVIVKDPRFNVQSEKLTVYMTKGAMSQTPQPSPSPGESPQQSLEKAVAEGNVGVVRDKPSEDGGPPQHSVGRGDVAIYTTSDGNVELRGSPRVQNGLNTHIATSPDTVMVMTQDGKLTTTGPSRTEIKQEPKASPSPSPSASPTAKSKS